jgi:hypothetical protein
MWFVQVLGAQRDENSGEVFGDVGGLLDPESKRFNLDGKPLRIKVKDIYFLTGLLHQEEVVNLKS